MSRPLGTSNRGKAEEARGRKKMTKIRDGALEERPLLLEAQLCGGGGGWEEIPPPFLISPAAFLLMPLTRSQRARDWGEADLKGQLLGDTAQGEEGKEWILGGKWK